MASAAEQRDRSTNTFRLNPELMGTVLEREIDDTILDDTNLLNYSNSVFSVRTGAISNQDVN